MKSITLFSNKKNHKEAAGDIIEQARSRVDFEPYGDVPHTIRSIEIMSLHEKSKS